MTRSEYALTEGKKAPDFTLYDRFGDPYQLKKIEADYVVLFFYPKDSTPGCIIEARGFNRLKEQFQEENAFIIGISGGDAKTKEKFCLKQGLDILLLSDSDNSVTAEYEVFGQKKFMGRIFDGIHRQTFILDSKKNILKRFEKVSPASHPEAVLQFIRSHRQSSIS